MVTESTADSDDPSGRIPPTLSALLGFGLVTRVIVVGLGCFLAHPASSAESWIEPWYIWDADWYAKIAERGYSYRPGSESSVAFLPALPLVIRAGGALGLDRHWVGLVVPNLAFAVGLALFGRCALRATGDAATTWRACLLLAAFPTSFFFSAPYQESLALALTAAALLAWLDHRPGRSATALAAASAARITALSMSVGLVLEWAGDIMRGRAARRSAWFVAIAGTAGLALFFAYLAARFHDPLLNLKAHASWHRKPPSAYHLVGSLWGLARAAANVVRRPKGFALASIALLAWPLSRPPRAADGPMIRRVPTRSEARRPGWWLAGFALIPIGACIAAIVLASGLGAHVLTALERVLAARDVLAAILFLGLGIHTSLKRGPLWGCLVLVPVLQALASGSTMSMARVVVSSYPAFLSAAEILSRRSLFALTIAACAWAQVVLLTAHVNGGFVD